VSKPGGRNVTETGVEPTSSGCMTGDRTTDLKRSAVMSGTGIHRLIYRDICLAATAHNRWLIPAGGLTCVHGRGALPLDRVKGVRVKGLRD